MKRKKLFILICASWSLMPFFLAAQPYGTIFGADATKWEIPFCNLDQEFVREQIAIIDTMINGKTYKKVGTIGSNSIDYSMNGNITNTNGFVREDSINGKAWFMGAIETTNGLDTLEFPIMDLSLNVNDTFIVYGSYGDSTITAVDSVYALSGNKYVRTNYVLQGGNQKLTFIEGVGTNYGLNYMHDNYNLCPCLISYDKDNSQLYLDSQCIPISDTDEEIGKKDNVLIYPHPISESGRLKFKNLSNDESKLIIFSSLGQTIYTLQTNNDQFEIANKLKLNGIYFYVLMTGNQFVAGGRISFID